MAEVRLKLLLLPNDMRKVLRVKISMCVSVLHYKAGLPIGPKHLGAPKVPGSPPSQIISIES